MTWLRRGLLALGGVILLALVALAIALPRVAASDAVRARLSDAVSDAAGLPFRYAALEARLFPPRLELHSAELGHEGAEPAARAERIELRVALLPLLRRTVLVDALVVEGASAQLVRRNGRLALRGAKEAESTPEEPSAPETQRTSGGGFSFAVRSARVADTQFALVDEDGARLSAGPLSADFSLGGSLVAPTGPFSLDLGAAAVVFRDAGSDEDTFTKPPGVPARLAGQLVLSPDGSAEISGLSFDLADLSAAGSATIDERARVTLDAERFALEPLVALVPGTTGGIAGHAALRALSFMTEPPTLAGSIELAPLVLSASGRRLELEGVLEAEGDRLIGTAVAVHVGEFSAPVDFRVTELFADPRVALDATLEDADSAALLRALVERSDRLSGPLDLEVHLEADADDVLATLGGTLEFEIAPGRLRGVSLLRSAVDAAGLLGSAGRGAADGDPLGRFYDDEFESLGGEIRFRAGVAHTDALRLVYPHYSVDLRGDIVLDGLALDMTGSLTIDEELDAALRGEEGPGRRRVIPLARVRGTVEAPIIRLGPEAIRMIAGAYATDRRREKWESKIDKYLGEGAGRELLDALLAPPPPTDPEPAAEPADPRGRGAE